ncbi:ATP-binding cassette domain-containing protein, partial [Pantoea sp. CTOTU49201]|uniref:ATP-binding cassette domain-containing protein n=1 Tax=Pantoea sp. CTOTU49201 TaxID=2953855 RepID=UPI00289C5C8D
MSSCFIEARNICKRFGALTALNQVNLSIHRGEVLALLGDNGAGKSTFTKVLSGAYSASDGELWIEGKAVKFTSPRQASEHGIATIYQELALAENLSIAENVFLGRELKRRVLGIPFLRRREMREQVD